MSHARGASAVRVVNLRKVALGFVVGSLVAACATACSTGPSDSQNPRPAATSGPHPSPSRGSVAPAGLIDPAAIDDGQRVVLAGNTHPLAIPHNSLGPLPGDFPLEHMQLVLHRTAEKETEVEALIDALHDKTSPVYHQWLSAEQFGEQYGVSRADTDVVTRWLEGHGFHVDSVPPSRMFIEFSGAVAQVSAAFHTEVDRLLVKGQPHIGNMSDPQIPTELAKVVLGVHALHDFMPHSMRKERGAVKRNPATGGWSMVTRSPDFTLPTVGACVENSQCSSGTCDLTTGACKCTTATQCSATLSGGAATCATNSSGTTECVQCASNADCVFPATCNTQTRVCDKTYYAVAPADFATIYDLNPLFAEGINGAGQTVVVIEDSTIRTAGDVTTFRSAFGLPTTGFSFAQVAPTGTTTCTSPGRNGNESEAALDAEWAGAAAPGAAIELAACKDTTTVFGGLIALQNLINGTTPPAIVSISYGECEWENGVAANASYSNTYQQAAAAGTSVFVSAGDELSASCDVGAKVAQEGISVSGFASTPYNVAVGGTDFMDFYNYAAGGQPISTYWVTAVNSASPYSSALSYVPEIPWNDSCASSLIYSTPSLALGTYERADGASGFCNSSLGASFQSVGGGSGGPSNYATAAGVGWPQPSWQTGVVGLPAKSGGVRTLPDVSLFAANGVWGHFYVYCMTDTTHGGAPCTYTNTLDTLTLAAGGTSFAAPEMAGIQALINQKMGGAQGNPNYTLYKLAAAEQGPRGSTRCNASLPSAQPDAECIFNDVTAGDIDVNCGLNACAAATDCPFYPNQTCSAGACEWTCGTVADCPPSATACTAGVCTPNVASNCFDYSGTVNGALSTSTSSFSSAFPAGTGWDYATGLGTVNAYNLVTAWSK